MNLLKPLALAACLTAPTAAQAEIITIEVPGTVEFPFGPFPPFTVDITLNGVTEAADFKFFFNTNPQFPTPFLSSGNGEFGDILENSGLGIAVTQGGDFTPTFASGVLAYNSGTGAKPGINYARYDVNSNGIYETVIELDFGVSPDDDQEDRITRIFYDNTDSNLNISTVVPEPASFALLGLGGSLLLTRHSRNSRALN